MKSIILIFTILMSFSAFATCESRNHIFLIHGVGGDEKTFGVMDKYLEKMNECYRVRKFTYRTGKGLLTTKDFAKDLNQFIEKEINNNSISSTDKISFIMHSQGGIIGSLWLLKARIEKPELYSKVDSFITLSTPYWGSTMARIGRRFFYTLPTEIDNPIAPVGRMELRDMSFGSPTMKAMQENFDLIFSDTHIRFLAIGGLKREYNPVYGEDDTTVSVYSSRPDHYALMEIFDPKSTDTISSNNFRKTETVPFIPVTATHFKIEIPGVAKIEKDCLKKACKHPSINYILDHLKGESIEADPKFTFRKYRVQVYLTGWEGVASNEHDVKMTLVKPHGELEDVSFDMKRNSVVFTTFSGILKDTEEHKIKLILKVKGKMVREFDAPIKGGFTTFLNLQMTH